MDPLPVRQEGSEGCMFQSSDDGEPRPRADIISRRQAVRKLGFFLTVPATQANIVALSRRPT